MLKETDELYKSKGLDVAKHNEMGKAELPLSATYIINQKGEIVYAFLEPDYKKTPDTRRDHRGPENGQLMSSSASLRLCGKSYLPQSRKAAKVRQEEAANIGSHSGI